MLGYPIETVVAEKLSTAIALGGTNTRDRDYADLWRLLTLHDLDGRSLTEALTVTAAHRGIEMRSLSAAIGDLAVCRQASYSAWRRRQAGDAAAHPASFAEVVAVVVAFADPLAVGHAAGGRWISARRAWVLA
jgi:Nucleotidyl transferase AbiEii toxin, Type IV TA system